jgi:hypothetical protein
MPDGYDFTFEATPDLGNDALACTLWRRGGILGPIVLILFPVLLAVVAWDPRYRAVTGMLGGAAIMLFVIFLYAVRHRRTMRRQFFANAAHRNVRVVMTDAGLTVTTALGESRLPWTMIGRIWRCPKIVLLYYQGWNYIAIPTKAAPAGAIEFAAARSGRTIKG